MTARVSDVLQLKGRGVFAVSPDATVVQAVSLMNRRHIGSVVVTVGVGAQGIFTERDVLTRVVARNLDPSTTLVTAVMTPRPLSIPASTPVRDALRAMTSRRRYHLLVRDGGAIVGLVSMADLVYVLSRGLARDVADLTRFVHGPWAISTTDAFAPDAPWDALRGGRVTSPRGVHYH